MVGDVAFGLRKLVNWAVVVVEVAAVLGVAALLSGLGLLIADRGLPLHR